MAAYRGINLALAFLLELAALVALAVWGWHIGPSTALRVLLAIALPLIAAVLWGMFAAPRARFTVSPWVRDTIKIIVYGLATIGLFVTGHPALAITFAALVIVNTVLIRIGKLDAGIGAA